MAKALFTPRPTAPAAGNSFVLSDGVSQHTVQPGQSQRIPAVAGRSYKLMKMGPRGLEPVANVVAVADGGVDDGDLRLMLDGKTEIILSNFYEAGNVSLDIPRAHGAPLKLDPSTPALSRGADGSDLVALAGDRAGLTHLAGSFGSHFDVLAADRFASAMVWADGVEATAPSTAAAAGIGGLLGATGATMAAGAVGSSNLAIGAGILAGLGAVGAGIAGGTGSSSSSSSSNTSKDSTTTVDPRAPVISVDAIATDNRINSTEYDKFFGVAKTNTAGEGLTISGTTSNVEDGNVLTVNWGDKIKTVAVTGGKWSVHYEPADLPGVGNHAISVSVSNALGLNRKETSVLPIDISANISFDPLTADGVLNKQELAAGLTITGTTDLEDGRTVSVMFGSVTKTTTASGGKWSTEFKASELPATSNSMLVVSGADAAGNDAMSMSNVPYDLSATIGIAAISDGYLNSTEATGPLVITGTTDIEAGRVIQVTWGGTSRNATVVAGATTTSSNTWSIQFEQSDVPAVDAEYGIVASGTDKAGNTASATAKLIVDRVAPLVAITKVGDDDLVNAADKAAGIDIKGTATGADGQVVTVVFGDKTVTATVTSGAWTANFKTADIPADGTAVTVTANILDKAGNAATQATRTAVVDTAPPTLTITPVAVDNQINATEAGAAIIISGTTNATDGTVVRVEWKGTSQSAAASGGTWSVTFATSEIPGAGPHAVLATAIDAAGNTGTATQMVVVDRTPPAIAIADVATDNIVTAAEKTAGVVVSGTTDAEDGQMVLVNWGGVQKTVAASAGQWSVTYASADVPADGSTHVTANVSDAAGNAATAADKTVAIDSAPPSLTINALSSDDRLNAAEAGTLVNISGTTDAADGTVVVVSWGGQPNSTTAHGGTWALNFSSGSVPADGASSITAEVQDTHGNQATATRPVTVDRVAPSIAISTVATNDIVDTSEKLAGIVISGTTDAEDGVMVLVSWGNTSRTVAASGGTWSVTYAAADVPANGSTTVTANVNDRAGNAAAAATRPVTVNTALLLASVGTEFDGFQIEGEQAGDTAGYAVSSVGDVNGDGLADQIIAGRELSGTVHMVYGQAATTAISLGAITAGNGGFTISGLPADKVGTGISAGGDVNGDGHADILVGASGTGAGQAYVLFGKAVAADIDLATITAGTGDGYVIHGESNGDAAGFSVAYAGDFNGDGLSDMLVTAPKNAAAGVDGGRTYLLFGKTDTAAIDLATLDAQHGLALAGLAGTGTDITVSAAGDVNGDGLSDLLVGTPDDFDGKGGAYVLFGASHADLGLSFFDQLGTSANDAISDVGHAWSIATGAGHDTITVSGASIVHAGIGNDAINIQSQTTLDALMAAYGTSGNTDRLAHIDGGHGIDALNLDGAGLTLDLDSLATRHAQTPGLPGRIESIEIITLTGSGDNTLKISAQGVLDITSINAFTSSGKHELMVRGNAGDSVIFNDASDWTPGTDFVYNGDTYKTHDNHSANAVVYALIMM